MKNKSGLSDLLFIIIIIFLALASVGSYLRLNKQNVASNLVVHTNLVKYKLGQILNFVREAEAREQSSVHATDSVFNYVLGHDSVTAYAKLRDLDSITRVDHDQIKLQPLYVLMNSWLVNLHEEHEKAVKLSADLSVNAMQGQTVLNRIQLLAIELRHAEDELLLEKIQEKDRAAFLSPFYSLILSFLAILFITAAYFRLRNETLLRMERTQSLNDANFTLKQTVNELEQSNTELASFNYIASHDLQEPLRKIIAFSKRIEDLDKERLSDPSKDYFSRIIHAASRMQNLIDAFLSYSQTTNSEAALELTDLNSIFTEVKTDFSDAIEQKNALLESAMLPVVMGIPIQLNQLFTNLIGNAMKYSRVGIAPEINVSAGQIAGSELNFEGVDNGLAYWKINVRDNGIGFDQIHEHQIFELFQRLHSKQAYAGTGIGLAICKKIMRNHKGFIAATGKSEAGATFSMYFPVLSEGTKTT